MIVVTTPTGQIGSQTVARLLTSGEPVRVIARDPSRLDPGIREQVEVVGGSHGEPAVIDRALAAAEALFWLVPPDFGGGDTRTRYLDFTGPMVEAIRRHGIPRVVGISSAGHGWPKSAGTLSAAFAMDAEIEGSGVAYRALSMPWFMENLIRQSDAIRTDGSLAMAYDPDRVLGSVATRDVAATAAELLADRSWEGQEAVPVFGPDALTPVAMAEVISEVLDREVTYKQLALADVAAGMARRGAGEAAVQDLTEMISAQNAGIYDGDQAASTPTATSFRLWCEQVLRPIVLE